MIRPVLAAALAMAALAPASAGDPVPSPCAIRPVEPRLEPLRGYYPRADRFVPVVAYSNPDEWAGEEPFEDERAADDGGFNSWEGGR